jgi:DNA-binding CsgD family transcriptional regulator
LPTSWLNQHEHELPQMKDGCRINGDPIIYTGCKPPEHIHRQQAFIGDDGNREIIEAIKEILLSKGLTQLQLTVLGFLCEGRTQKEIAAGLGVSRERVKAIQNAVKKRLGNMHVPFCRSSEVINGI